MLEKLKRLHKSKIVIAFLIALVLVFSYEQSKPKAFVPLAWAGYILAGMAAETLVTMGVKGVSKAVMRKQADNYATQVTNAGGFNFLGTNPYRNKDGSITLSPTANDRAKLAGLIAGAGTAAILEGIGSNGEPLACEKTVLTDFVDDTKTLRSHIDPYSASYEYQRITFSGTVIKSTAIKAGEFTETAIRITSITLNPDGHYTINYRYGDNFSESSYLTSNSQLKNYLDSYLIYSDAGASLCTDGEIYYPSTIQDVYIPPWDIDPNYKMPNYDDLHGRDIVINNILPPSENEGFIEWTDIEEYYNGDVTQIEEIFNQHIDKQLNNSVIGENIYNIGEINNIYTDIGQDVPKEDLDPPIIGEVPDEGLPEPIPDGEIVPVSPVDRSMLQIAKESYQYLSDTVKSSINGLTTITAGAAGLITFLSTTMSWLPEEWIVMFSAAFGLGLFAFFFRR